MLSALYMLTLMTYWHQYKKIQLSDLISLCDNSMLPHAITGGEGGSGEKGKIAPEYILDLGTIKIVFVIY